MGQGTQESGWRERFATPSGRSLRLFADARGAPRARRPTDVVLLVLAVATLAAMSWAAEPPGEVTSTISRLAGQSPGWLRAVWEVVFDLLPLWSTALVVAAVVRRHLLLALTAVVAPVVGVLVAFVGQWVAVTDDVGLADYLSSFTSNQGPPEFPGVRIVAATAVVIVMSPALSRPYRFFGRILLAVGFVATVGLDVATVAGAIGGLAAGAASAATVHLVFGSPGGRPNPSAVSSTLAQLGVALRSIEPASIQPAGIVSMHATDVDGRDLDVKVYGRDAWDGQLIAKLWRWVWYRNGDTELFLSRLHQVEHEALMTVLAGRAGARVPDVVTAGLAADGDAALVATAGGRPLRELLGDHGAADETADVTSDATPAPGTPEPALDDPESTLDELWTMMRSIHEQRIVHGSIDLDRVTIDRDGHPLVVDWAASSMAASAEAIDAEQARLLVVGALLVGSERAVLIALPHLGEAALAELVPYLQAPALTTRLRHTVKERDLDLDELRTMAAETAGVDEVELVKLQRVTIGSVLSMALLVFAAWLLITAVADVGLDTLVDELSSAAWGWVLIALIVAQAARVWNALATTGATKQPLPLGPLTVLEFAITFVNLVVPSSAGRIATKMRFFQKVGLTLTAAVSMSALDSLAGFIVQILILAAALAFGLGGVDIDFDFNTAEVQRLVLLAAVIAVVGVVVAVVVILLVKPVRDRVAAIWRQVKETLRVLRSPERLLRLFGGNLGAQITFAMVLGLSLRAYGESAPLVSLVVVNVMVALLAGLMPVPGGIGVSEAATTAGLVAIGVPQTTAVAAAITTRLCTYYLPPIWGYVAMRWLRTNRYL